MSQLTICLIISVLTVISFVRGKLSLATTAMTSMMLFFVTGCIDAETVLGCFSNASGIMIAAMFVVAAGFNKTKFVRNVASGIGRIAKGSLTKVMIGYVLAALLVGFLAAHGRRTVPFLCLYMVAGCAACYLLGTLWFSVLSGNGFVASLAMCVFPYLPCDVFKILLAAVLTRALDRRLALSRK